MNSLELVLSITEKIGFLELLSRHKHSDIIAMAEGDGVLSTVWDNPSSTSITQTEEQRDFQQGIIPSLRRRSKFSYDNKNYIFELSFFNFPICDGDIDDANLFSGKCHYILLISEMKSTDSNELGLPIFSSYLHFRGHNYGIYDRKIFSENNIPSEMQSGLNLIEAKYPLVMNMSPLDYLCDLLKVMLRPDK